MLRDVREIIWTCWPLCFSSGRARGGRVVGLFNRRVTLPGGKQSGQHVHIISRTFLALLFLGLLANGLPRIFSQSADGISCRFKQQSLVLPEGMRKSRRGFSRSTGLSNASLDTLSNWFSPSRSYVEIIRQDDPLDPRFGIALGFEFDENNGEYPYTPAFAKIQVKDFRWGGVEFSLRDTFNYTGVSNEVSDDLSVEVDGYRNDTIFGRFSGLLLSGAGPMAPIDSGYFRAFVYRVE